MDTVTRKIQRGNTTLRITPKALDILQLLLDGQGKVVTKEELFEKIWNNGFVEEGNIAVQVAKIRKLLETDKNDPYIETVSGVGYRFVARVAVINENEIGQDTPEAANTRLENVKVSDLESIAVLPFEHTGMDEELEYLSEGLTEGITNSLSRFPDLRVLSRNTVFQFRDHFSSPQEAGRKLGVNKILVGRARLVKQQLVVGTELIRVSDNSQIWGSHFHQPFSDIFDVQQKIAHSIAESLRIHVNDLEVEDPYRQLASNPEAYRLYLKGKYFLDKRTIEDINKAITYFQESISIEDRNTPSQIGLANSYLILFIYGAIQHQEVSSIVTAIFEKISNPEPQLAEFHWVKAKFLWYIDWKFEEAERYFKKAISADPNSAILRASYSLALAQLGKADEALGEASLSLSLDPISRASVLAVCKTFFFTRRFQDLLIKVQEILDLNEDHYIATMLMGWGLGETGKYQEAINAFKKAFDQQHQSECIAMQGYLYASWGKKAEAHKILEQLDELEKKEPVSPCYRACVYGALNDTDMAFEYLEKAFLFRDPDLPALLVDCRYKSIRKDPRFEGLIKRIGI